ncbi:MAG: epoxyqueuosine reductase QueH [Syntrophorhabdaceae bacterium]|nr:epoxyqueuosine reductase QueH [Syntrophorhabdaceae bacterium]
MDITGSRILLHICCAPCSIYSVRELRREGAEVSGYFYNPNIHPYTEFSKRLATLREFAGISLLPLDVDTSYDLESFLTGTLPLGKDRCLFCYRMRLERAFQKAARERFDAITTTLLYSRYQRHDDIKKIGEELSATHGVPFVYRDFRTGWQEGINESKRLNMYRQQYCGCIFSEKERYGGK